VVISSRVGMAPSSRLMVKDSKDQSR
jgi:hypothetical protein